MNSQDTSPVNSHGTSLVVDTTWEKIGETNGPKTNVEQVMAPHVGMLFETMEQARNYYENYGRQEGFWIRIQSSSRTRLGSNDVTSIKFVCAHQGKYKRSRELVEEEKDDKEIIENEDTKKYKNCSTVKCGCEASMRIVLDKWSNKWKISVFKDIHNHKIVSPAKRMKMKSNKHMPEAAKSLTETFQRDNMQIGKVCSVLGGSNIGFNSRDCYNHLRNVRHRQLDGGDAQSVLTYFRKKQAQNPQFFYAIQCDENGRATNFFWVDSRSRIAYHYFGDVVTFDTTYRTNKYDMQFAPFTGVNHHLQSIQFGCALLQDETEATFLWLFETWLEAMGGHHPISIITDQDLAKKGAIAKVLPNSHHRLCLWHIKKKFVEKLSHVYFKKSKFKVEMKKCIFSYKVDEFEKKWKTLVMENGLENNEWLNHLHEIRSSWVPAYNRSTFFAGMNTTGRSEGINSFFDGFVTSKTNLREFVIKYEQALKKIIEKESYEDFESEHKYCIVDDGEFLLKHAAQLYTRRVFNKFKDEWHQVNRYKVEEKENDNGYHTYIVKTKLGESEEFVVKLNLQTYEVEFTNLRRHFLKVFVRLDIDTIPNHFVLPRWRQEANKFRISDSEDLVNNGDKEESEALRLSHMCQQATKLACIAASSNERYMIYMTALNDLSKKFSEVCDHSTKISQMIDDSCTNVNFPQPLLLDPNISQTKGRKRDVESSKRIKSSIEVALNKKKRTCRLCHKFGHDKRNCSLNLKRKKMESNSEENEETQKIDQDMESSEDY